MSSHYFAMLSRMKHINRWGLMRNTHQENLSEHSLETAFIAHALCVITNTRFGGTLDAQKAAVKAMFHDTSEIITGDLPTPIKYNNPEIKEAYKKIEESASQRLISMLPEDMRSVYSEIYAESGELKKILRAADKISALIKCIEERRMGNDEFAVAEKSTEAAIRELGLPAADVFLEEFLPSYGLTLDEQKMDKT